MPNPLPTGLLALPGHDERALPSLTRKLRLLALRRLWMIEPSSLPPSQRVPMARLQRFVRELAAGPAGDALVGAVGEIDVLAPLLTIETGMTQPADWVDRLVPQLLIALERRTSASQRDTMLWDVPFQRAVNGGSMLWFDPPARGLLLDAGGVEVRCADGRRFDVGQPPGSVVSERVGFALRGDDGPELSLVDTNPLAMLEEHPDKAGNAISLGDHDVDAWLRALRDALELIEVALPELAAEMASQLQRIVPVGFHAERHMSASYREAPGLIYLSLHPSVLTMAEALIHETQHGKINTLRWFDAVLLNGESTWTPSPVRPDLRPLFGVLMAVHAFVPVAALHMKLRELGHPISKSPPFEGRAAQVLEGNAHGLATLRRLAEPTKLGQRVLDALEQLHAASGGDRVAQDEHEPVAAL